MPGLDGHQTQEALNEKGIRFPVLILTGMGDIDRAVRAMKNGAFEFIEKPYVEEHLLATLDNAFGELDRRVNAFGLLDDAKLRIAKLSKRERQVMQGLLDGLPNKLIAYHLGLSIFPAPTGRLEGDTRRAAERKRVYLKADAIAVELDAKANVINVSETGLTGETDARIIVGEHVEVSFSGLHYVPATVRWVHGRRFGLKLLAPPPVIGAGDDDLTRDIRLFVGQTSRRAVVRNVSSTGLQIETDLPLHKGQQVLVKVLNGWSIMTRVAWVDGIRAGVSMDDPVDLISFEKTA